MNYLTEADVEALNASFPDAAGVLNQHLLGSAVGRPQASAFGEDAYPDVHMKAAVLFCSLAQNHAFAQANKRTAVKAAGAFYALNGWVLRIDQGEMIHLAVDVVIHEADEAKVAERFALMAEELD